MGLQVCRMWRSLLEVTVRLQGGIQGGLQAIEIKAFVDVLGVTQETTVRARRGCQMGDASVNHAWRSRTVLACLRKGGSGRRTLS
jgi:hypothetical protein